MKKSLLLLFSIISFAKSFSQGINFSWANQLDRKAGLAAEESYFIGTDSAQNVYVAGNFRNTIDLDPGAGVNNVTSSSDNIFVCKLDPSGNFLWGKQLGNGGTAVGKSLAVDKEGNIYTTGYFSGEADFDPSGAAYNLSAVTNNSTDNKDVFISKLNANGDFQWAIQIGSSGSNAGTSITVDVFGNVYTTGFFSGVADLDPGDGTLNAGGSGIVTAFIIKLEAGGSFKYGKVLESNRNSTIEFIRTDNKGNVYISGHYNGTIDFDPGDGVKSSAANFNSQNTFLEKLDTDGNFVWVQQDIIGYDFEVDENENVYTYDAQLSKYDSDGKLLWSKLMGGGPYSSFQHADIKIDASGNIYITGMFRFTQDFDPSPAVYKLTSSGNGFASDIFVCKLNNNGDFIWANTFGSYGEDYATGLDIDDLGNVYTTGVYQQQVDFDPGAGVYNLTASPAGGIFIDKMSPCTKKASADLNITECKSYTLNNITYDSTGTYRQTIVDSTGCDSIITLNLLITSVTTNLSVTTCEGYNWQGNFLTKGGAFTDTLVAVNGCDSVVHLDLTINDKLASSVDTSICTGRSYNGYTAAGTYIDTFHTVGGCDSIVTTHLSVFEKPLPYLGPDTKICSGDSLVLRPGDFQSFLWQDNSTQNEYLVKKAGLYSVAVSNACGIGYSEVTISESTCNIYFPNVFTPNNDGKNEKFHMLNPFNVTSFHLSVFNRYGQKMFETKDYTLGWNGMYKDLICDAGTYVWYCEFKESGVSKNLKGTVLLIK